MWIDEEKPNENPVGTNQNLSNPSVGSGGGAGAAPGTGSSSASNASSSSVGQSAPAQGPNNPQPFATVQDYLKTNQPQAEDLGQKFTSSLDTSLGNEKSAIDTAANQTQNDINAGTINYNADLTKQAINNPTQVANDPNQLAAFQKQWNASYTGPSSFEASTNYAPASTAAQEAATKATQLGTEGGREQLIQDQFGVYGQGNKGLDQALLQTSSAFPTVQNQASQFGTVQDYLTSKAAPLDTAATTAQTANDAARTQTQSAFANNLSTFQNKIASEVQAAQTQAQTAGSAIQNDLKTGDGADLAKDLGAAGVSPENVQTISQYLQNLNKDYQQTPDLSNYYTQNPATDINAGNVATPEEYANAAAYNKLTGVDYSGVLNPANASQAGTANLTPQVNATDLQSYLKGNLAQRDSETLANAPAIMQQAMTWNTRLTPEQITQAALPLAGALSRSGIQKPVGPAPTKVGALREWSKSWPPELQAQLNRYGNSVTSTVDPALVAFYQAVADNWH